MYNVTRWFGRKGVALSTLGGIDIALWDIRGKAAGKPIYEMLGACRHSVPAYASALLWRDNPNDLRSEAARYIEDGFRAMKMRLGRTVDYDLEALTAVRQTIGPRNRLMVDANARYTLAAAQRLAPVFKEQGVFWLEEPFQPEALDDFRALRGSTIPVKVSHAMPGTSDNPRRPMGSSPLPTASPAANSPDPQRSSRLTPSKTPTTFCPKASKTLMRVFG